tara:strand:- start:2967 stop:3356 length:390 start_codon:yes stop_codon:yes gene_type:complete
MFVKVEKGCNINTLNSIMSTLGLVLLLLLSPCKVRNFIQAELGIPQTTVLNKSQSTISASSCSISEVSTTVNTVGKSKTQQLPLVNATTGLTSLQVNYTQSYSQLYKAKIESFAAVPLYILYQNFKDYL